MISFRTFLFESEFEYDDDSDAYDHVHHVHGHEVHINFQNIGNKHYETSFLVNGEMNVGYNNDIHPHHAAAILHHIRTKISQFAGEKKPKGLVFRASDESGKYTNMKDKMYQQFANHLEKRGVTVYNGKLGKPLSVPISRWLEP
jgi:hypothetical protein